MLKMLAQQLIIHSSFKGAWKFSSFFIFSSSSLSLGIYSIHTNICMLSLDKKKLWVWFCTSTQYLAHLYINIINTQQTIATNCTASINLNIGIRMFGTSDIWYWYQPDLYKDTQHLITTYTQAKGKFWNSTKGP